MREFLRQSNTLSRLSVGSKVLYVSFLGLVLLAFASSVTLYYDSLGLGSSTAAAHYLGNMDDPDATEILLEKSPRQLLEVTHFHLYTMPILLLVLGHLTLMARGGEWKAWVLGAAGGFTVLHVAAPFIVRFGGAGFGWIMPATALPFVGLYVFLALWPLPDLLSPAPQRRPDGEMTAP